MRILKSGDPLVAICERCEEVVAGTYQYRPFPLEKSGVVVPNVLVGVCGTCGEIVSLPAQSTPRLKEARERQMEKVPLRFSRELEDVLGLVSASLAAPMTAVPGMLVRYYLEIARRDPGLRRRIVRALDNPILKQPRDARAAVSVNADSLDAVEQQMAEEGVLNRSDLFRGMLMVAGEDILDNRAPKRRETLMELAVVTA
jgi:hypothetical protein